MQTIRPPSQVEKPQVTNKVCEKIAGLIMEMDSDVIGVQEGPKSKEEMELFVSECPSVNENSRH